MGWVQWVTLAIAVIGAGLGVFNTFLAYRRGTRRIASSADSMKALGEDNRACGARW